MQTSKNKKLNTQDNKIGKRRLSLLSSLSENTEMFELDETAQLFLSKNNAQILRKLALFLVQYYNKIVFNNQLPPFEIQWSAKLTSCAGITKYKHVKSAEGLIKNPTSVVVLSKAIITKAHVLRDVLAHEMCHVATWLIDKTINANHGKKWKFWTLEFQKKFPELPFIEVYHDYEVHWKFKYTCLCGFETKRMTKIPKNKTCSKCLSIFTLQYQDHAPRTNGYTQFVKANIAKIKQENPMKSHGELMKIISNLWKESKI